MKDLIKNKLDGRNAYRILFLRFSILLGPKMLE